MALPKISGAGCPVCGIAGKACLGHEPYRLPEDNIDEGGLNVASKAVEGKIMRMPKQYVRPGRGVAGYTGKVQVYDVKREKNPTVVANPAGDVAPTPEPEKIDANKLTREKLESIAAQRGITQEQMDAAQTKAELVDLIEKAGP